MDNTYLFPSVLSVSCPYFGDYQQFIHNPPVSDTHQANFFKNLFMYLNFCKWMKSNDHVPLTLVQQMQFHTQLCAQLDPKD